MSLSEKISGFEAEEGVETLFVSVSLRLVAQLLNNPLFVQGTSESDDIVAANKICTGWRDALRDPSNFVINLGSGHGTGGEFSHHQ